MARTSTKKVATTVADEATVVTVGLGVAESKPQIPTDEQLREAGHATLSARIRALHALGVSTSEIAKTVKRSNGEHPLYQHVRNVLNTPLKGKPE